MRGCRVLPHRVDEDHAGAKHVTARTGLKYGGRSARAVNRGALFVLGLLLGTSLVMLTPAIPPAGAVTLKAGYIEVDTVNSISVAPPTVDEGGAVTINVILFNNNSGATASDVNVDFHKNDFDTEHLPDNARIAAVGPNAYVTFAWKWQNLTHGDSSVWVRISHLAQQVLLNVTFVVNAKPDLVPSTLTINLSGDVLPGDAFTATSKVCNIGGASAAETKTRLEFQGGAGADVATPQLASGHCADVSASFTAPAAGGYTLRAIVDTAAGIAEREEGNNIRTNALTVSAVADFSHVGDVTVTPTASSLAGPWTVNGTIQRGAGGGPTSVDVAVRTVSGDEVARGTVNFTGVGTEVGAWQLTFDNAALSGVGDHELTVKVDPDEVIDQTRENDLKRIRVRIIPVPNIRVDGTAGVDSTEVHPNAVTAWRVGLTNQGEVPVTGTLTANWAGVPGGNRTVQLDASESRIVWFNLSAPANNDPDARFTAVWASDWDSNDSDNMATRSIAVREPFNLTWRTQTMDSSKTPPFLVGETVTVSIEIQASGPGTETFDCVNVDTAEVLDSQTLEFQVGGTERIDCDFVPRDTGMLVLRIVAQKGSVASHDSSWRVQRAIVDDPSNPEPFPAVSAWLFAIVAILLIIVAIAAYLLTQPRQADIERDIYEYCPSCNGELEGDEHECPHCGLDLVEALSKFHDCETCNETIPDVLEFCPVCGTAQHPEERFERRERTTSGLIRAGGPTAEPTLGDDEIVTGSTDFEEQLSAFGMKLGGLEKEWDTEFARADAAVDAMLDRREARQATAEEHAEDDSVASPLLRDVRHSREQDVDAFLPDAGSRRHLAAEDVDFTASDAAYRKDLYELTGEEGVLPGERVNVAGEIESDNALAGNELRPSTADFSAADNGAPRRARSRGRAVEDELDEPRQRRSAPRGRSSPGDEDDDDPAPTRQRIIADNGAPRRARSRGRAVEDELDEPRQRRSAPRGRSSPGDEDDDDPPPTRQRIIADNGAPRRARSRGRAVEDELDEPRQRRSAPRGRSSPGDEDDDAPRRARSRGRAVEDELDEPRQRRSAPRGRSSPDDEDDDDPPPTRRRSGGDAAEDLPAPPRHRVTRGAPSSRRSESDDDGGVRRAPRRVASGSAPVAEPSGGRNASNCPSCGSNVASTADTCPVCGHRF